MPFSDPLADGPVIHAAATAALEAGATLPAVLEVGRALAEHVPVVLMCYANPIVARGLERFVDALAAASISGLIVPDLPLEESADTLAACDRRGIALVPLVAPTTPDERLARIGAQARGFLYAVSLTGTTGERANVAGGLAPLVRRAAEHTEVPVAVGFGIGTPEQAAAAAAGGADGVIIGSRLVRAAGEATGPGGGGRGPRRGLRGRTVSTERDRKVRSCGDGPDSHRHCRPLHLDRDLVTERQRPRRDPDHDRDGADRDRRPQSAAVPAWPAGLARGVDAHPGAGQDPRGLAIGLRRGGARGLLD